MNNPGHNGPVNKAKLETDLREQIRGLEYDRTVPENSTSQNWRIDERLDATHDRLEQVLITPAEKFATEEKAVAETSTVATLENNERSYRDEIDFNEDGTPNVMAAKE